MQHLPRPWMLAALTAVPVTFLARQDVKETDADGQENAPPRPEARRRRLSARHFACQCSDRRHGDDCCRGTDRWRDVEVERAA
jgi:hypothetical protein